MKTFFHKTAYMRYIAWLSCIVMAVCTGDALASGSMTLGNMATSIIGSFTSVTKLVTGGAYVAGIIFAVVAVFKFKQYKDAPQQTQIGTPIALVFVGAVLIYLPTMLGITGQTMFGSEADTGGGPTGTVFTTS